ncbi:MAG: DUF427 domain-containing protein [Anaerolineae bacterium]|jgi:uncharacterized protein (DUF427 family)|nr:DUF427 domain-containing protein [Anaerolineae bacterium]
MKRIQPAAGQESVWDYPRPPRLERVTQRLRVIFAGVLIADTTAGFRILETSHPPAYYLPPADVQMQYLHPLSRTTFCEFKGAASYWSVRVGDRAAEAAVWGYRNPAPGYEAVAGCLSFYAGRMDACYVGEEQVTPQEGDFYGGWITSSVVGPFKGGAGTWGW